MIHINITQALMKTKCGSFLNYFQIIYYVNQAFFFFFFPPNFKVIFREMNVVSAAAMYYSFSLGLQLFLK